MSGTGSSWDRCEDLGEETCQELYQAVVKIVWDVSLEFKHIYIPDPQQSLPFINYVLPTEGEPLGYERKLETMMKGLTGGGISVRIVNPQTTVL